MPAMTRDDFPSNEDYLCALYPTVADRLEAEEQAAAYANRVPEATVNAELVTRRITKGTLVLTDEGGKGYAGPWAYDGFWNPMIEVRYVVPPPGLCEPDSGYYSPSELTPYWGPR